MREYINYIMIYFFRPHGKIYSILSTLLFLAIFSTFTIFADLYSIKTWVIMSLSFFGTEIALLTIRFLLRSKI
ncbi:hypothetical protein QBD00_002539 [Ochrobactrum sp. AN78]|nr:hypothetical protein [Ochrobactrum sp. AN78]